MTNFQVFVFSVALAVVTLSMFEVDGQYYGRYLPCPISYMDPDGDCVAGIGGKDYPMLDTIPKTNFKCSQNPIKYVGYFADVQTQCQVFHVCTSDGQKDTFLCPNGTLFNQQFLVCDWWFNVKCQEANKLYSINDYLQPPMNYRLGPLNPKQAPIPQSGTPTSPPTDSPQQDRGPSLWSTLLSAASSQLLSSAFSSGSGSPSKGSVSSVPMSSSSTVSAADTWSVPVSSSMSYPESSVDRKDDTSTDSQKTDSTGKLLSNIFSFLKTSLKSNSIPVVDNTAQEAPILPRTKQEESHSTTFDHENNANERITESRFTAPLDIVGKPRQF